MKTIITPNTATATPPEETPNATVCPGSTVHPEATAHPEATPERLLSDASALNVKPVTDDMNEDEKTATLEAANKIITPLLAEYEHYVQATRDPFRQLRTKHGPGRESIVVTGGAAIIHSMLRWKTAQGNGRLANWTSTDIGDYMGEFIPQIVAIKTRRNDEKDLLTVTINTCACIKDYLFFLADRGMISKYEKRETTELINEIMSVAQNDLAHIQRKVEKIDGKKVGRNDLCPCGSGQKYKQCHGGNNQDNNSSSIQNQDKPKEESLETERRQENKP